MIAITEASAPWRAPLLTLILGVGLLATGRATVVSPPRPPAAANVDNQAETPVTRTESTGLSGHSAAPQPEPMARDNAARIDPYGYRTPFTRLMPIPAARPARMTSAATGSAFVLAVSPGNNDRRDDLAEMAHAQRHTR